MFLSPLEFILPVKKLVLADYFEEHNRLDLAYSVRFNIYNPIIDYSVPLPQFKLLSQYCYGESSGHGDGNGCGSSYNDWYVTGYDGDGNGNSELDENIVVPTGNGNGIGSGYSNCPYATCGSGDGLGDGSCDDCRCLLYSDLD